MYSITVRIDGIENRRRSAGLLHVVIGFFMIVNAATYYRFTGYSNYIPVVPILLIASVSLFYGVFRRKLDWNAHYNYWLRLVQVVSFTILGILLTTVGRPIDYMGVFIFTVLSIILLFSERRIFQETVIMLTEEGITIPGYYRDHLVSWEELSEVVIREDFITLFHIKQKYLQYQVKQDLSTLELAKMNAFCRGKIEEREQAVRSSERQS
ncbi:MAG: hypothetical protein ACJ749_18170 [Flavisolibacter sp.]